MSANGELMVSYFLKHSEYDPALAREYYLRNRVLKGRAPAAIASVATRAPRKVVAVQPRRVAKPVIKLTAQQKRTAQLAKIKSMEVKLQRLKKLLATLVAQAQRRSGVDPVKSTGDSEADSPATRRKAARLTPQQRAKKAQNAEAAYQKERKSTPDQKVTALSEKIKAIEEKLADIRATIAARSPIKK